MRNNPFPAARLILILLRFLKIIFFGLLVLAAPQMHNSNHRSVLPAETGTRGRTERKSGEQPAPEPAPGEQIADIRVGNHLAQRAPYISLFGQKIELLRDGDSWMARSGTLETHWLDGTLLSSVGT
jgi:hypothetical protein